MSDEALDWIVRQLRAPTGTYRRSSSGSWSFKDNEGGWVPSNMTDGVADDLVKAGTLVVEPLPVVPGANRDMPANGEDAW